MVAMQFAVEASTQGGIRLGKIAFGAGGSLDTPLCLLYARSGAVPHLAKDVAKDIPNLPRSSLFCLPAMLELTMHSLRLFMCVLYLRYEEPGTNFASDGIHKFLKLQVTNYLTHTHSVLRAMASTHAHTCSSRNLTSPTCRCRTQPSRPLTSSTEKQPPAS